ncbi:MAG: AsmA family protein, partial [Bacteroidales bacterium]|nr:AsmA family protein [Bacteroidales bacterium]
MTVLKRIAKILKWTVLAVCGLILLLYALIHLNVVQKKITSFAVQKISDKLGMQIAVGRIYPLFWDGVVLQDVSLLDAKNDTVLVAKGIMATVRSLKLDSSFVAVGKVALQKPDIRLVIDSSGVMNIQPLLDAFQSDDTTSSFHLDIDEITIRDANFSYKNYAENQQVEYGINYDNIAVSKLFLQAHSFCMNNGIYQLAIDKFSCNEQSGLQIQYLHTNALVCDTLIRCSDIAIYTPGTKLSANRFEMRYASFSDFSDFCENVRLSADFNHSTVSFSDISYFASALQDFPYSVTLEGLVEGTVSDMAAKNLHI